MYSILALLGSAALFGMVALPVAVYGFHTDLSSVYDASSQPESVRDLFYACMFWSFGAYPVTVLVQLVYLRVWHFFSQRRMGSHHVKYRIRTVLPGVVKSHVTEPFTILGRESRETELFTLRVVLTAALWLFFAVGYGSLAIR